MPVGPGRDGLEGYLRHGLASLDGFAIDCGSSDEYRWIPEGCAYMDAELTEASIPHDYLTHTGDRGGHNTERIMNSMLPFFSEIFLAAED